MIIDSDGNVIVKGDNLVSSSDPNGDTVPVLDTKLMEGKWYINVRIPSYWNYVEAWIGKDEFKKTLWTKYK